MREGELENFALLLIAFALEWNVAAVTDKVMYIHLLMQVTVLGIKQWN